jgi:hypothetical protein
MTHGKEHAVRAPTNDNNWRAEQAQHRASPDPAVVGRDIAAFEEILGDAHGNASASLHTAINPKLLSEATFTDP